MSSLKIIFFYESVARGLFMSTVIFRRNKIKCKPRTGTPPVKKRKAFKTQRQKKRI